MKRYLLFVLILVVTAGCSSGQLYKVDPLDEKELYNGREIVTKESENSIVSVEFDGLSEGQFIFYVDVQNLNNQPAIIDPAEIFAEALQSDLLSNDHRFPIFNAVNPENEIDAINKGIKSRKTFHEIATGANAAFTLLSIIGTLADNNSRNDGHKIIHKVGRWADVQIREEIDYDASMKEMETKREFWRNEALRLTELEQDEVIGGLIFIPFNPKVKYLRVVVPVEKEDFEFFFKVVKVN
ncbi:MAG: hypothetical protein KF816_16795 [Melioribacteraceae bacterium]|nr:hypothetical protein [Melioribacteraceae bacterium]